ncbi:hypothetical protein [Nocardia nova]|uniref:hypothetical protein n=1 Tax=Nocardia nova TaxID=37330 RepID=UPI0033E37E94
MTLLQGVGVTVFTIFGAIETRTDRLDGSDTDADMIALVLFGALSALLLAGAILLLARRTAGRVIVIGITTLVLVVIPAIAVVAAVAGGIRRDDVAPLSVMLAILVVIELPILVCAVSSSTERWIAARNAPAAHYPYY